MHKVGVSSPKIKQSAPGSSPPPTPNLISPLNNAHTPTFYFIPCVSFPLLSYLISSSHMTLVYQPLFSAIKSTFENSGSRMNHIIVINNHHMTNKIPKSSCVLLNLQEGNVLTFDMAHVHKHSSCKHTYIYIVVALQIIAQMAIA